MYNIFRKLKDTVSLAFQRYDLSPWQHGAPQDVPVYGVYHVYCDNGWQQMVTDQMAGLRHHGLMDRTTKLYVSCITRNDDDTRQLQQLLGNDKVEIIANERDPRRFEYPALHFLRQKSLKEHCLFYYFHTKGITYQALKTNDRKFCAFKRNIEAWRKMMEYFLFEQWQVAVNALTQGYDTYGCYRLPPPPRPYYLYAGNFWWARSEYVRRLPEFDFSRIAQDRFFAEEWLYKAKPRDFSAFDTMADLYYVYIPRALYADGRPGWWLKARYVLTYNAKKFRKQILHYDYKAHYQKRYQRLKKIEK